MPKKIPLLSFRNDQGFTLMEVMIAIAIFAIGFMAVAAMQISVSKNNRVGNTYTQALALAHAKMEELKNENIHDPGGALNEAGANTEAGISKSDGGALDENGNTGTGGIYNRSWTIARYKDENNHPVDQARLVTVRVSFPLAMRGTQEVSVTSVITGGGL
ncbi:prepilin-type N-terminal cleavage/methylation domain-containing protein [Desulfosarcina sp. OttesenSCG-928-G10]|nr:prepilin-type N-terminal cleavage/methylation domain-containing protein [Desulfosarcina sp. OttesenSCG-928-G10]MDL2320861.1 prepilin-type N-terminal cleavage/methylation domain-containing protein [Desulfosarcina sp. OttesenSCG-928-B08]